MATFVANVPIRSKRFAVPTATPLVLDMRSYPFPLTVTGIPGGGGTINVEVSTYPDNPADSAATWQSWEAGATASRTTDVLMAPVAWMRITAASAAGAVELVG